MQNNKLFNVPFEKLKNVQIQGLSCEQYYQIKNFLKKYAQTQIHVFTLTERETGIFALIFFRTIIVSHYFYSHCGSFAL